VVVLPDQAVEHAQAHPDVADADQLGLPVQEPQHDLLAVNRHVEGGADVGQRARLRILELDASILVPPAFGDVGPGKDLDAADDGGAEVAIDGAVLHHDAVEAKPHPQARLERLDVNVTRTGLERLANEVHHDLHRRVLGRQAVRFQPALERGESLQHQRPSCNGGDDVAAEHLLGGHAVCRIERIGKGDGDAAAGLGDRNQRAFLRPPQVHPREQGAIDVGNTGFEQRQPQEVGQHLRQPMLGHHPAVDEDLAEALPATRGLLCGQGGAQLGFAQVSQVDQQVAEPHRLRIGPDGLADLVGRDDLQVLEHREEAARCLEFALDARRVANVGIGQQLLLEEQ
jgi:hypothetical protein